MTLDQKLTNHILILHLPLFSMAAGGAAEYPLNGDSEAAGPALTAVKRYFVTLVTLSATGGTSFNGLSFFEEHAQVTPPNAAERVVPPFNGAARGGPCGF